MILKRHLTNTSDLQNKVLEILVNGIYIKIIKVYTAKLKKYIILNKQRTFPLKSETRHKNSYSPPLFDTVLKVLAKRGMGKNKEEVKLFNYRCNDP